MFNSIKNVNVYSKCFSIKSAIQYFEHFGTFLSNPSARHQHFLEEILKFWAAPRRARCRFRLQKCMNFHSYWHDFLDFWPTSPLPRNHQNTINFHVFGRGTRPLENYVFSTVWRPEIPYPGNLRKHHGFPHFLQGVRAVRKRHFLPRFGDRFW